MKIKEYVSPEMEIIETKMAQFICASGFTGDDEPHTPGELDDDDEP